MLDKTKIRKKFRKLNISFDEKLIFILKIVYSISKKLIAHSVIFFVVKYFWNYKKD